MCTFEFRHDLGTSQFMEANSDTLPRSGKEIKVVFGIHLSAFLQVQLHISWVATTCEGSSTGDSEENANAISILVSKIVSSKRQERESTPKMTDLRPD